MEIGDLDGTLTFFWSLNYKGDGSARIHFPLIPIHRTVLFYSIHICFINFKHF